MSRVKIYGISASNIPWQEKPEGLKDAPVWRYSENPVIGRNPAKGIARIFNSAVMPYEGAFIGVFRGGGSRRTAFHTFILGGAGMPSTGNLMRKKFRSRMKRAMILCPDMHTIRGL